MSSRVKRILKNPKLLFMTLGQRGFFNWMDDETYLRIAYRAKMGRKLRLNPPITYNEKLQWLKIHDRNPVYTQWVDKYEAKVLAGRAIGEKYIIPTLGVWQCFDEIDFDILPEQFVLKCTHDSGGLVICRSKLQFDRKAARRKIEGCLKHNFYYGQREWPYKDVKPRIIAEKYMEDSETSELRDYKVYTFGGKAMFCMINQEREIHTRADYFDRDYNWLDFTWGYDHADVLPEKPKNYELMYELAEKLALGTAELRVDFYEVNGQVYFGEVTFFDGSGFSKINPVEWDYKMGSMIQLPVLSEKN